MVVEVITGVSTFVLGVLGSKFWDNRAKVRMKELEIDKKSQVSINAKLSAQTEEIQKLEDEVMQLKSSFNSFTAAFEMFFSLVKDELKDKPLILKSLEILQADLKKK